MKKPIFTLTIAISFLFSFTSAQNVINGSFEKNTGICIINGDNATITSNVSTVTAYGCGNEIDLMNNTCGYGTAVSGEYFLCLANGSASCPDACTLELDEELQSGKSYTVSYYDRGWDVYGCCPPGVPLEVGVSTSDASQGTIVYTSPVPTINTWTKRTFTFVAPSNGQFLSFQAKTDTVRWTHIDSVTITAGGCPPPENLSVNHIQATSANLKWSPVGGAIGYKINYKEGGTTTWLQASSTDNHKVITGLSPNTKYIWKVKTVCSTFPDVSSIWSVKNTFITKELRLAGIAENSFDVYPNPVVGSSTVTFSLNNASSVEIQIIDINGRIVKTITSEYLLEGNHDVSFNCDLMVPGVYFLQLRSNDEVLIKKILVE